MPEGDTLHRLAARLGPALEGRVVSRLALPRSSVDGSVVHGARVTRVEALGKNLLIRFESGHALHTHLRMNGSWHLYAPGSPWRVPRSLVVVVLEVEGAVAVCAHAPVVRLLRERELPIDPQLAGLGPDLLGETFDASLAVSRLRERDVLPLGEALMDQRAVAGIGNVWKSELCFALHLDPFAPVARFTDEELTQLLERARKLMQRTARLASMPASRNARRGGVGALSVYRRAGERCPVCGAVLRMERQGEAQRSTYFCPGCQPRRAR